MNRRRVSSPPTARARVPLNLSHPFTSLDARHATESTTEGLTESTTEGLKEWNESTQRVRAPITRNAMISTRNASIVPCTRSRRSKRSFVHVIARSSLSSRSSRSPARVVIHVAHARRAFIRGRARGGDTDTTTSHDSSYHFSCLFPPRTGPSQKKIKKKSQHPREKHTRPAWGGYTRVMTQQT